MITVKSSQCLSPYIVTIIFSCDWNSRHFLRLFFMRNWSQQEDIYSSTKFPSFIMKKINKSILIICSTLSVTYFWKQTTQT